MSEDLDAKVMEATGWSPLRKALHASRGGVAVKIIEFDGSGGRLRGIPMALRTLSADESLKLRAAAFRWLTTACDFTEAVLIGTTDGTVALEFEVKVRTIALALVEPAEPHRALAKDADDLRTMLDSDEIAGLFEHFVDWVQERSPITSARGVEEVAALCDALGKGTLPLQRLNGFDASTVRTIARELAARLMTQTSSRSSPTQPSTDTETNISAHSE